MIDFPEGWIIGRAISDGINAAADWVIVNWDAFFDAIKVPVLLLLKFTESSLLWLPWWVIIAATGLLAWKMVGKKTAVGSVVGLLVMGVLDSTI